MELSVFYKAVLDEDIAPVVLCDLDHTIVYMNPAAIARYANRGGTALLGKSLMACHNPKSCEIIERCLAWLEAHPDCNRIYEDRNPKENKDVYFVALRDEQKNLIGYYEKHEYRTPEEGDTYKEMR